MLKLEVQGVDLQIGDSKRGVSANSPFNTECMISYMHNAS